MCYDIVLVFGLHQSVNFISFFKVPHVDPIIVSRNEVLVIRTQ